MGCLKCGRDTTGDHVFCDNCQQKMAHNPVAPGTAVHLPQRTSSTPKKAAPRKRAVPPEEQILSLRKSLRRARTFALIMVIVLAMTAVILVHQITDGDTPIIGQNYTIDTNLSSD